MTMVLKSMREASPQDGRPILDALVWSVAERFADLTKEVPGLSGKAIKSVGRSTRPRTFPCE